MTNLATSAKRLADLVERQAASGLITNDLIRVAGEVQFALNTQATEAKSQSDQISLWLPEPDTFAHQAIGKLIEEMGEATAIAARILIQGLDHANPKTGIANREALAKELADVSAAVRFVQVITMIDRMPERAEAKFSGFSSWVDLIVEHQHALEAAAEERLTAKVEP